MPVLRPGFIALAVALGLPALAIAADPASVLAPVLHVGDAWVFDETSEQGVSGFSERRLDLVMQRVSADGMLVGIKLFGAPANYEDHAVGLDWSESRIVDGVETPSARPFSFPLTVGKTWSTDFVDPRRHGLQTSSHVHKVYKVVGWEPISTLAGTFRALKIEARGTLDAQIAASAAVLNGGTISAGDATAVTHVGRTPAHVAHATTYSELYYVPEVKYYVKSVEEQYNSDNVRSHRETRSLVSYKAR